MDIGEINFPVQIDFRIKCHREIEMKTFFESKKFLALTASISIPDAKTIFTKAPFIQYEQLLLDKNFRQYLKRIMVSKTVFRTGVLKTPIQKTYEMNIGTDSINIDILSANRQFDWIEISLVYHKSDKHTTMYNSYNVELAAKTIKSVKLSIDFPKSIALQMRKI